MTNTHHLHTIYADFLSFFSINESIRLTLDKVGLISISIQEPTY